MNKRKGMSVFGYAIVVVILIAVGMIISAPFVIEQNKSSQDIDNMNSHRQEEQNIETRSTELDMPNKRDFVNRSELHDMESRLYQRIDEIERKSMRRDNYSDKYICSIEGGLNESGVVVPIDPNNPPKKFVFSC